MTGYRSRGMSPIKGISVKGMSMEGMSGKGVLVKGCR